ncbi:TNF receptor-associated factor 5-like isoform X3 [Mustelus asterias]
MASEESCGVRSSVFIRQDSSSTSLSLGFDPYQTGLNLQFVEPLEDRYKCATCSFVLCNPYQTGCGHRFCENCIAELIEIKPVAVCPIDHEKIIANWIFRDNCCKREVWNLMVYCKNAPDCNIKESFGRLGFGTHLTKCPETEVECSYKKYGCPVKEKRRMVKEHEHSYLNEHLLLVVTNNTKLEEQILDLKKTLHERNQAITQLEQQISKLDIEIKQLSGHVSKNDDEVAKTQKTLAGHADKIISIEQQSQQLCRRLDQEGKNEISELKEIINVLKEKVERTENNIASLVTFEPCLKQHELLLSAHKKLLEKNNERFQVLEATGYNGKLIWKICNYRMRKQEAAAGSTPSLFSQSFYTSRCGYKLCARAYLNGDGTGKGTHLSLFFVVMKGDYDSLLSWPFKQKVSLILLDQGPKKNHVVELFKADANSTSFRRPVSEMNIASGCPKFMSHTVLESGKTATFIKDDTLFIKVIVDLSDLEDL